MRKVFVILLILLTSSLLFAETLNKEAVITARKRGSNNGSNIPSAEAQIRLSDGLSADFGAGANLQIPVTARTETYTAFTWYYSGNLFNGVTVSFGFSPMRLLDEEASLGGTYRYVNNTVIPYTVYFVYNMTRIGNSTTNINKGPTNLRHEIDYWTTKYYLSYADSVSISLGDNEISGLDGSTTIINSGATFTVNANLYPNSVVYDAASGGNIVDKDTFSSKYKDSSGNNVTPVVDYWVRSGSVMVDINIDDTGKNWTVNNSSGQKPQVAAGIYYAEVTIGFTAR